MLTEAASSTATMNHRILPNAPAERRNHLYNSYGNAMKNCFFTGDLPKLVFKSVTCSTAKSANGVRFFAAANNSAANSGLHDGLLESIDQDELIFPLDDPDETRSFRSFWSLSPTSASASSSPTSFSPPSGISNLCPNGNHTTSSKNNNNKTFTSASASGSSSGSGSGSEATSPISKKSSLRKVKSEHSCVLAAATDTAVKKNVSFADQNGGQLEFIKLIQKVSTPLSDCLSVSNIEVPPPAPPPPTWYPSCIQPAAQYVTFREKLERELVSLENLRLDNPDAPQRIYGTIKVRNVSFWKEVFLRVTFDNWATQQDVPATYQPCTDQHSRFDTFGFSFALPSEEENSTSQRIECVVCYRCDRGEFWDNNQGANYVLEKRNVHPYHPVFNSSVHSHTNPTVSSNSNNIQHNSSQPVIHRPCYTEFRSWSSCTPESRYY